MNKKRLFFALAVIMALSCLSFGCKDDGVIELRVVSSYHQADGNRENYVNAYKAFEESKKGKVKIIDNSSESNESWKKEVLNSFKNDTQPDVLFFYTGADADDIIQNNQVMRISEIKKEYPDYADNMQVSLMPTATNGMSYAVPVNAYWEGLYINKTVLADCGVDIERILSKNYSWNEFLSDCQTIKDNGFVPIACPIGQFPHYFFEFCIMNNGDSFSHLALPSAKNDNVFKKWANGLNDIKQLWDNGFFAENALSSDKKDIEQVESLIVNNQAAFMIEGSWKINFFIQNAGDNVDDFAVTYVPAKGNRVPTQIVGGLSMGYYITKKAWDNPKKRQAAVEFVMAMTTDEVVSSFGALSVTALKNQKPFEGATPLELSALNMINGRSAEVGAVQDLLSQSTRDALFGDVKNLLQGNKSAEEILNTHLLF